MDSTLNDKLMEGQLASLDDEQFSNLARELGVNPSDPPASIKTFRAPLATIHRLANWRYVAFVGSLLAASIGVAAWWWSSSAHTAMMEPSAPAPLTQAALEAVAPLKVRQEQLARDNENVASQLKASQEEMARNNNIIEQIKATQIQMARESETVTERLNASQEQLAHVIANASEPKVMPEEPKVMPEIPVPRPRRSTNVAQTTPQQATARPQAKKPQTSLAWPWSVR
jgi:endonuclease/exonuclease/phosphatase (EEP) superfamily protein YafD